MRADGPASRRTRRLAPLVALAVLLALTAFAWWLSGRWLARPDKAPPTRHDSP